MAGDRVYFGVRGHGVPGGRPPPQVALPAQNGKLLWEMELEGAMLSARWWPPGFYGRESPGGQIDSTRRNALASQGQGIVL